ncbi:LytR family transcriptional regulator, partial [Streptomyces sp. YS-3]
MDAQSRGRAEEVDPADQWVLNPETGNYELRLTPSGPQSSPSAGTPPRRTTAPGRGGP